MGEIFPCWFSNRPQSVEGVFEELHLTGFQGVFRSDNLKLISLHMTTKRLLPSFGLCGASVAEISAKDGADTTLGYGKRLWAVRRPN